MNKIKLFTKDNEFVTEVLFPIFEPEYYPDVVLWNERFFKKVEEEKYVECFAMVVFTQEEWKRISGIKI